MSEDNYYLPKISQFTGGNYTFKLQYIDFKFTSLTTSGMDHGIFTAETFCVRNP